MLFRRNFIDYVKCDITVKDVTNINRVVGIGTTLHKFVFSNVKEVFLPCVSYHLSQTHVQLFAPQIYHQINGIYSEVYDIWVSMYLTDHQIHIPVDRERKNPPIVYNSFVLDSEKRFIGTQMRSALSHTILCKLEMFGDLYFINNTQVIGL